MANNFRLLHVKDLKCLDTETKIISSSITWLSLKGHLVMLKRGAGTYVAGCHRGQGRMAPAASLLAMSVSQEAEGSAEQGAQQKTRFACSLFF